MQIDRRSIYVLIALFALVACQTAPEPTLVTIEDLQNTATAISATLQAFEPTASPLVPTSTPTATSTPAPADEPTPTVEPTVTLAPTAVPTETPVPTPTATPTPEPQTLSDDRLTIIAGINSWRVRNGAWPLQYNEILEDSAQRQADYLQTLSEIPSGSGIHRGPNGESSPERVYLAGWPPYGEDSPNRITASEITYVGNSPEVALGWWNGSSTHFQTAINFTFREIGIGVADHPYGAIYVVALGSRPGVIPTLYDPASNAIYLGQEESIFRIYIDNIRTITHYQFVDSATAEPVEDNWERLVKKVPAPEGSGPFFITYLDENLRTVTVEVDPAVDIAWFPENLPDAGA